MKKKNFSDLLSSSSSSGSSNSLFTNVNPSGYFSNEELVNHLGMLSEDSKLFWQLGHLKKFFDCMKAGLLMQGEPRHTDLDGVKGTWLRFILGKRNIKLRINHFSDMKRLIDDYANSFVKVNQSLEELYNEANA